MLTEAVGPRLDGVGTAESVWTTGNLVGLPALELAAYRRAVFVAPHPDDEVLASGGLMQRLSGTGTALTVVGVTDGEASHPRSLTVTPMVLTDLRARERKGALDLLGVNACVHRLGLPDGAVGDDPSELAACLRSLLGGEVLCVAPWKHDGHPDHDATGRVAAEVCAATGATFLRTFVWTWHWATPADARVPWARARRLALTPVEVTRKRWANRSFRSQINPLSEHDGDEAILPPETLARFDRTFEVFLT